MRKIFLAKAKPDGTLDYGSELNLALLRESIKQSVGKTWRLELPESKRSLSQNRFYWLYLGIIEQETGNNSEDLHELFKRTLLPPKFIKVMGVEIKIPMSTKELSKHQFGEYMDKISAKVEIAIPNPADVGFYTEY